MWLRGRAVKAGRNVAVEENSVPMAGTALQEGFAVLYGVYALVAAQGGHRTQFSQGGRHPRQVDRGYR